MRPQGPGAAGAILALSAVLALAAPRALAEMPVCANAAEQTGISVAADPPGVERGRRARATRDREARQALAESDGRIRLIAASRLLDEEFTRFDPDYREHQASQRRRLDALKARLDALQGPGHWLYCSQQLYDDAEWLVEYTALWPRVTAALDTLEASFAQTDQEGASRQAEDGSWGGCRPEFVFRLDSTVNALNGLPPGSPARLARPLGFLAAVSTPVDIGRLTFSRLTSAIAPTGVYGREEIASLTESLPQLLFKPWLATIADANGATFIDARFIRRYAALLDTIQDPVTGFWGPRLSIGGETLALPDLSMTFHIVSYRLGCVERWPQLIDTLFAVKEMSYPFGWLSDGRITTHNAYDVVRLLRLGWPHADDKQRDTGRRDIAAMLDWALRDAVMPDGTVVFDPEYYETEAAAYYFAVALLDEAGYWQPARRFWSEDKATGPGAEQLCRNLKRHVEPLLAESSLAVGAYQRLQGNCA